jgi:sulfur carrier protein
MSEVHSHYSVSLNGQDHEIREGATLQDLLVQLHLAERRIAIELNGRIVPKSAHGQTVLESGAVIEIITAVGGG